MRIILVKFMGLHYHLYLHYILFSDHTAVFKPKHHVSDVSVVMLESPNHTENNPDSGAE
jgi:hypothetical protein